MKLQALCKTPLLLPGFTAKMLKIMKLTALLIFIVSLQVSSNTYAQEKISLTIKNGTLESVLKAISKQTGYLYVFQDQWKEKAKTIDISVTNISLEEALDICFKNQPFTYAIIKKTIVVKEREERTRIAEDVPNLTPLDIHGRVTDENNQPVAGVTVTIKGTKRATSTDNNGEFNFKTADNNATLIFTSVNMETYELKINGNSDLSVKLRLKTKQLGEVAVEVNTGYQKLPKERATGSFDFIDNNTINQQVGSNIVNRLDGVASGVIFPKQNLQGAPAFMIRGFSTINGPNSPLIVVDNFPYDGDIANINPNDVESITILKDAAAASIWGARAGNGVVVITTKKGRLNQPLRVGLTAGIITTQKPSLDHLNTISSSDYIDVEKQLFNNGYWDSYLSDTYAYLGLSPVVEILNNARDGSITQSDANAQIDAYRKSDIRQQYSKYMYRKAATQQYALNLQGGSNNISYYLSAGYDKIIDKLDAPTTRLTFRSDNTYKPLKNVQISLGVQYTQTTNKSGRPAYGTVTAGQWSVPYLQFADANGNPLPVAQYLRQPYTDTAGAGKLLDWNYYPLEDYKHSTTSINQQDLIANIGLNYQVIPGLNLDVKYLYERQTGVTNFLSDLQSYYARSLINTFSQIDPNTGSVTNIVPKGGILNLSNLILESQNIRGQINYAHSWKRHNIVLLGGSEIRQAHTTGNSSTYFGYDPITLITTNVDLVNLYPTYINGNYTNIPGASSLSEQMNRYVSVYGNAAYTYNDKYTVSASGRRDASNLFGVSTNNKWKPLWSTGASWLISSEQFYRVDWLPFLKFRLTYGFSGNADPTRTGVVTLVYSSPTPPTNLPFTRVNQFPNPDLRWEKVGILNIGLDFKSKNDIFSGSVEGYFKKGFDLFGAAPVDPTAGLNLNSTIHKNVANMSGKGVDLSLTSKIINRKFSWLNTILFNYNTSKTTKYYIDSNRRSESFIGSGIINPIVGQPLYSVIAFPWAGLDSAGNPRGYLNGKVSEDYPTITLNTKKEDLVYRQALPVFFGFFINTFKWNKFDLTVNVSYRFGYYFMRPSLNYSSLFNNGAWPGSSDYAKRWQKQGDEKSTDVPSLIYPADPNRDMLYNNSEILIDRADNIRLQYVNLSYDLENIVSKKVQHLLLYINASNLGVIWKANKDGIDPDYISVPIPGKVLSLGLRANF